MIESTTYEGELYRGQVKTRASRNSVPIPDDIIPIVEAWRQVCPDISDEALMFPTFGRKKRKRQKVPRRAKNFLKWRIHPIAGTRWLLGHATESSKAGYSSGVRQKSILWLFR